MPLICVTVGEIVDHVHDPGQRAEDDEGRDGASYRRRVEQVTAEQHAGEDEQVLGALFGAERGEEEAETRG